MNTVTIRKSVKVFAGLAGLGAGIVINNAGKALERRSIIEAIPVWCFAAVFGVGTYTMVWAIGEKIVDEYPKWKKEMEDKTSKAEKEAEESEE